jgi:hypothetical protein
MTESIMINGVRTVISQHAYAGFNLGDKYGQYWKVSAHGGNSDSLYFETNNRSIIRAAVIAWQSEKSEKDEYDGCSHCGRKVNRPARAVRS